MSNPPAQPAVVVAGHICLDLIPSFPNEKVALVPGTLVQIGASTFATGGVSNTAVALTRLGVPTTFIGKVGDDQFGSLVRKTLQNQSELLARGLVVAPGEITSYTYVISPPGVDRMFLHCPGANDTFNDADVPYNALLPAKIFHFGYPPLMAGIRANRGAALTSLLKQVKQKGLITSLDLTYPDPASEAGRTDWRTILANAASHLDIFLPSIEEILQMLDRPKFDAIMQSQGQIDIARDIDLNTVASLASELLNMGVRIVGIKLGNQGIYLRTTSDASRLTNITKDPAWVNRELLSPCFKVNVVGTTGSGDATIAGFLAAVLRGESPEDALISATAVGACCCEKADSTSGMVAWDQISDRIHQGWPQHDLRMSHEGWKKKDPIWIGPQDAAPGPP